MKTYKYLNKNFEYEFVIEMKFLYIQKWKKTSSSRLTDGTVEMSSSNHLNKLNDL
jgi:hypothetical protein